MIKLIEAMIESGEGNGSRRVQLTGLTMLALTTFPAISWQVAIVGSVGVMALTVTDVVKAKDKREEEREERGGGDPV